MTFAPSTAIKLGLNNSFGQLFNHVKNHLGALSQPVSADYLHIRTSIIPDGWEISAEQEIHYKKIIADAAEEINKSLYLNTGKISVTEFGYVLLEVNSPELEKIMNNMRTSLQNLDIPAADPSKPIHIVLQAGTPGQPLSAEAQAALEEKIKSSQLKRLEHATFYLPKVEFGAIAYGEDHRTVQIKTDWPNNSMPPIPSEVLEAEKSKRAESKDNWAFLGNGSYNYAYKSKDGKEVLKIQKEVKKGAKVPETDFPERSVRLWNAINVDLPPARLQTTAYGKGWVCPFVTGEQAPDKDMAGALIGIFNRTGRIIADAIAPKNFIKTPDGKVVCVDIGLALQLERREEHNASELVRRKSMVSLNFWQNTGPQFPAFFKSYEGIYPQTVNVVKALIFIKKNRPDILDVTFLKTNPTLVSTLAQAYDHQLTQAYDRRKVAGVLANFDRLRSDASGPIASAPMVYAIPQEAIYSEFNGFLSHIKAQNPALITTRNEIRGVIRSLPYQNSDDHNKPYVNVNISNPEVAALFKEYLIVQRAAAEAERVAAVQNLNALQELRRPLIADYTNKLQRIEQIHQDCKQDATLSSSEKKFMTVFCNKLETTIKQGIEAIRVDPSPKEGQKNIEQAINDQVQAVTEHVKKIPVTSGLRGIINSICEVIGVSKPFVITNSSVVDTVNQMKERLGAIKASAAEDPEQQVLASPVRHS